MNDPLLAGLAAGYVANRVGRNPRLQARRRPGSRPHLIFTYVAGGMVVFFLLLLLIGMLATRRGREALSEGCLDAILGGLFGGG